MLSHPQSVYIYIARELQQNVIALKLTCQFCRIWHVHVLYLNVFKDIKKSVS